MTCSTYFPEGCSVWESGCICLPSLGRGNDRWKVRCERRPKSQREFHMLEQEDVVYGKVQSHCSICLCDWLVWVLNQLLPLLFWEK